MTPPPVVVVSGIPRSGTSLLMQMLAAGGMGVVSDGVRSPDASNRRGYLEHERVKRLARDPEAAGWLQRCASGRALKVIHALAPALPVAADLEYRVVMLRRDFAEVVASQARMLAAAGEPPDPIPDERLAEVLRAQWEETVAALRARADCAVHVVGFERLLDEPAAVARELCDWLGAGLDQAAMAAVVDAELPGRAGPGDRYTAPMADPGFDDLDEGLLRRRSGEKWQVHPPDVLPLWVADMDFLPAEPIRRRLQECLDVGDIGYPMHPKPTGLPEAFCDRAQRKWGWAPEPGRVELITEVVQGMHVAIEQFSEPGDGVIVQPPIYPPFLGSVGNLRRRLCPNPLVMGEGGYRLDLDGLAQQAEDARILLLCNPHNPTGRVFRREELMAIAEIAIAHDLLVVSDEIHQDLVYPGGCHVPFASLSDEVAERTLTLTSASKAFNIAGLRCAIAVFGSAEMRRRFLAFPRHLRGGLGSLGIQATLAAWTEGEPWLRDVLAYLEANRDFVAETVRRELPGVRFVPPQATYLFWLDFRELGLEPSPYRHFLDRAKVALSDGADFGPEGRGHARINFATSRPLLEQALTRLLTSLPS